MAARKNVAAEAAGADAGTAGHDPEATVLERSPAEAGAEQVQAAFDEAHAQGFHGVGTDEHPKEHYTVAGRLADMPKKA